MYLHILCTTSDVGKNSEAFFYSGKKRILVRSFKKGFQRQVSWAKALRAGRRWWSSLRHQSDVRAGEQAGFWLRDERGLVPEKTFLSCAQGSSKLRRTRSGSGRVDEIWKPLVGSLSEVQEAREVGMWMRREKQVVRGLVEVQEAQDGSGAGGNKVDRVCEALSMALEAAGPEEYLRPRLSSLCRQGNVEAALRMIKQRKEAELAESPLQNGGFGISSGEVP